MFSTSIEVGVLEPSLADLISHIRDLELSREHLQDTVERLKHTESGLVQCGHSSTYTGRMPTDIVGDAGRLDTYLSFFDCSQSYPLLPACYLRSVGSELNVVLIMFFSFFSELGLYFWLPNGMFL